MLLFTTSFVLPDVSLTLVISVCNLCHSSEPLMLHEQRFAICGCAVRPLALSLFKPAVKSSFDWFVSMDVREASLAIQGHCGSDSCSTRDFHCTKHVPQDARAVEECA